MLPEMVLVVMMKVGKINNNSQSTSGSSTTAGDSSSASNHNHAHAHNHGPGEECNSDDDYDSDDDEDDELGLGSGKRSNEGIKKMLVAFFKDCCACGVDGHSDVDGDFKQIYDCFLNEDEKKFLFDCVVFG
ncbi:unnamed protein product [Ambrosiozyma monospora]|uniref:Unnamed protein product n=1 Tax=Ambrosiozyma monospora TaxID=43982 RepID=A0ACB5UCZ9_AMBMO|nr:unnamed protein product [Ambrosiozyma monospora]